MGKSEYRRIESALRLVLMHQLKWQYQPSHRSRSWADSIRAHLGAFEAELEGNPGLKLKLDEILGRAYKRAREEAAKETGLVFADFPPEPPDWGMIRSVRGTLT